jgi:hypothetical protein
MCPQCCSTAGYEYNHTCLWHDKGRKRMSGSQLEPLINACCKVTVNVRSRLQECTVRHKGQLRNAIFKK